MKNNLKISVLCLSLVFLASGLAMPSAALAKGNKDKQEEKKELKIAKKEEKKDNKKEKKIENQQCWNGFFHRNLPFGIWKKWFNWNDSADCLIVRKPKATTTIDLIAPTIENIMSRTTADRAFVSWQTNEKASGQIYWSTSSPVNLTSASTKNSFEIGKGTNHYLGLNGLASSTTYHAIIVAKDNAGNTATSSEFTFATKGGTVVEDTLAPVISSINTTVSSTTIGISYQTNEAATSKVYFGTTSPVITSASANFVSNSTLQINHSLNIDGLATSTLYYLLLVSHDASGNTATSSQFSTTTLSGL